MKRHDGRVARHRTGHDVGATAPEEVVLAPVDEAASRAGAEDVERHDHHPQSEASSA